jgi:hypothetical protein
MLTAWLGTSIHRWILTRCSSGKTWAAESRVQTS